MKVSSPEGLIGFRVTTPDRRSLGLRKNPNVIDYLEAIENGGTYALPAELVKEGKDDWGGIWVARTLSSARKIVEYMRKKHQIADCRIFLVTLGQILYKNSYRIKTNEITFLAEVIESENSGIE